MPCFIILSLPWISAVLAMISMQGTSLLLPVDVRNFQLHRPSRTNLFTSFKGIDTFLSDPFPLIPGFDRDIDADDSITDELKATIKRNRQLLRASLRMLRYFAKKAWSYFQVLVIGTLIAALTSSYFAAQKASLKLTTKLMHSCVDLLMFIARKLISFISKTTLRLVGFESSAGKHDDSQD